MTETPNDLAAFGWSQHFQSQLSAEECATATALRVVAVHRDALEVVAPGITRRIAPPVPSDDETAQATVGDWLLVDGASPRPSRVLARKSLFKRRAAGTGRRIQLIAANVDTLLIVTSCNQDFNVARLERYLALAREAEVTPVVVLTKADLTDDAGAYVAAAARLMPGLPVETLDAREPREVSRLASWCGPGQTVALVGSSGVGKSTIVNTLVGRAAQATSGIREDDDKGRHTTSGRSLHRLATGGWLLDTPGMRELQLTDAEAGIEDVFAEVVALGRACRFADCRHEGEPGCAVQEAVAGGGLDPERLRRYRKLAAEEARNAEALHERRARERGFGRMVKEAARAKRSRHDD